MTVPLRYRSWRLLLVLFIAGGLWQGLQVGWAGEDVARTFRRQSYPHSTDRHYIVHLPTGYDEQTESLPLVMVLHGCSQDHRTIKHDTRFDEIADREKFITVYPDVTSRELERIRGCWGWWLPKHIHAGTGDVQDLGGILEEVRSAYRVDPNRIHVVGLSSGGCMAMAVMVVHSELVASGCSTAGVVYSERLTAMQGTIMQPVTQIAAAMNAEMGDQKRPVPILVVQSEDDTMVNINCAHQIRDAWGEAFGVDTQTPIWQDSGVTKGTPWAHKKYQKLEGRTIVETFFVKGLKHGWPGGRENDFSFPNAPNTAELAWEFFEAHPKCPNQTPELTITGVQADQANRLVQLTGTVADDGPLEELVITVELLGLSPQAPQAVEPETPSGQFDFSSATDLPNDQFYRPEVTVRDAHGASVTVLAEPVALGNPSSQPPQLTIDSAGPDGNRIRLSGSVSDDVGIVVVEVLIKEGDSCGAATLNGGHWSFEDGPFAAGSYLVHVRARDREALDTTKNTNITVLDPFDDKQQSDLTGHIAASRIRMYGDHYGSADKPLQDLIGTDPLSPFWLYRARGTDDWYADPGNIGRQGGLLHPTLLRTNAEAGTLSDSQRKRIRHLLHQLLIELDRE